jgi:hypothetical protein
MRWFWLLTSQIRVLLLNVCIYTLLALSISTLIGGDCLSRICFADEKPV